MGFGYVIERAVVVARSDAFFLTLSKTISFLFAFFASPREFVPRRGAEFVSRRGAKSAEAVFWVCNRTSRCGFYVRMCFF